MPIPRNASFENLKKQAKTLHKSLPESQDAVTRVAEYFDHPETASLQQVQLVVAREYGFESWSKLKSQIIIAAHLAESSEKNLADSILGTHDLDAIEGFLNQVLAEALGWREVELFHFELSVGAAFGLRNAQGEKCLLKVLSPDDYGVEARRGFQIWMREQGFPCPKVILPVTERNGLKFLIEEYNDAGRRADGHLSKDRRLMALLLYRMMALSKRYDGLASVPNDTLVQVPGSVWPKPHNVYFDFEATRQGAEWIDEAGARFKPVVDAMEDGDVLAHMDWSAKHLRIDNESVSVTYDWDSVARVTETRAVGAAAAVFTYSQYINKPNRPELNQSKAFIADYEAARGAKFSAVERDQIYACMVYTAAYGARCEHAIDHSGPGEEARTFLKSLLEAGNID